MQFRLLVFINALVVSMSLACMHFYFQRNLEEALYTFAIAFALSFLVFYYMIEKYVHRRILLIYKFIHNLKLGKDLKNVIGEHRSDDPINDLQKEVREWAIEKKAEIDTLKNQEQFRREFLSNISHEFKTPLFAVQGYLEALKDGLIEEDVQTAQKFLDKASQNVDRLNYLINDLNEISKLENREIRMNYTRFDIASLIKEVLESLDLKAKKYHIHLVFKEKYHGPTWVYADREKMRQVLINLVSNSIKYGKEDGYTHIKTYELFDQILIEVTDDGMGIEERYLPRLFERFFRTEKSRSRQVGGSGLGLAIVKHILEAHQQTISVRSTEGIGSTFAFTIQKAKPKF
ncbi:sensor histidine kinase [Olivibacter sitiensis]|uniref:sensor histidine kinase n=1 Tax=Olivibacter sitiensis TaxID=376470 RepID=UPI0003FB0E85|nr:ATP-binding protein [Olivibacter sitiensis]